MDSLAKSLPIVIAVNLIFRIKPSEEWKTGRFHGITAFSKIRILDPGQACDQYRAIILSAMTILELVTFDVKVLYSAIIGVLLFPFYWLLMCWLRNNTKLFNR